MPASPFVEMPQFEQEAVKRPEEELVRIGSVPVKGELDPRDPAFTQNMTHGETGLGEPSETVPIQAEDLVTGESRRDEQSKGFELNTAEWLDFKQGIDGLGDSLRDTPRTEQDALYADEVLRDNLKQLGEPHVSKASRILGTARNIGAAVGPHVAAAAYNMLKHHIAPEIRNDVETVLRALSGGQQEMTADTVRVSIQEIARSFSEEGKGGRVKQIALAAAYGASYKTRDPELRAFALQELVTTFSTVSEK